LNNNNFSELADNLTTSEKKLLLSQISDNLTSNPILADGDLHKQSDDDIKEEMELFLKKEIDSLGLFQKIILVVRSFLVGKKISDVLNKDLLQNIERRISVTAPTLVSTKKRRFTGILINDFSRIYSLSLPFIPHFTEVWESPIVLERLISEIISEKYNSIKTNLSDFLSEAEIDKSILAGYGIENVKKKLLRAVYEYRNKMPEFIFPESEDEILSLISLKNIILYNYAPMFKLMGISLSNNYELVSNKTVSMSLVIRYIEEFYKLLIHFSGVTLKKSSMSALIKLSSHEDAAEEDILWDSYNKLSEKLKSLTVDYPFEDLIKFAKSNPFYKINFTLSRIDVADFYFSALKKEMLSELNTSFVIREHVVVNQQLEELFKNFSLLALQNYKEFKEFEYKKNGLKYFKYTSTLTFLLNFLKYYYLREYKDIIFVLSKHVFEKNHILQSRLLELTIGVDTLLERIIRFDKSLGVESETGKTMRTLFTAVSSNRQNIRMYKAFIKQKDEEVLELLNLGVKLLTDLVKILNQTIKNPSDNVRLQISAIQPSINRKVTFKEVLVGKSVSLSEFVTIFKKKIIFDSEV